jgi:hypothetical protein
MKGIKGVPADSFAIETSIHYPAKSGLAYDRIRKAAPGCVRLANERYQVGRRQAEHLTIQIKKFAQKTSRIAARKIPKAKASLPNAYEDPLNCSTAVLEQAKYC